jgi:LysR family hydrogen peroxide-inducible transcriptional activator
MNLRDLEYLVALADHGHFGRAARACGVSQPTLSAQLRKLEDELGEELVERGTRPLLLTGSGDLIVRRARNMLAEAAEIERIGRQGSDPATGSIRLGIFPSLAAYLLPHVLPGVRRTYPDLDLQLVEEKSDLLMEQLRAGVLDAAILALPVDEKGLQSRVLFDEEFLLAVPATHELSNLAEPVDQQVLAGQRVLLLDDGHCLRDQALAVCQQARASEREFRATSLEILRQMVTAGGGVTLLPQLAVTAPVPPNPDLLLFRFTAPVPHRRLAMLCRSSGAHRSFLGAFSELFRPGPDTFEALGVEAVGLGPGRGRREQAMASAFSSLPPLLGI